MATITTKTVYFDTTAITEALKKTGLTKGKISTMLLGRDQSYLSNATINGKINADDLKKLCDFLSLDYDKTVVVIEESKDAPKKESAIVDAKNNSQQLDLLIVGINKMYETQKAQNELIGNLLVELKATNTKINRLENALGQIVSNAIEVKQNTQNELTAVKEIKSSCATISGRLRDMNSKFK